MINDIIIVLSITLGVWLTYRLARWMVQYDMDYLMKEAIEDESK